MLFNVVVDVVVRNFLLVVSEEDAVPEGCGRGVHRMTSLFYTDDSIIASTQPE